MTLAQGLYIFILGAAFGLYAGVISSVCRVYAEKKKTAAAEARAERANRKARREHARRLDEGIAYDDKIERYEADLDDYRREFRKSVRDQLEATE